MFLAAVPATLAAFGGGVSAAGIGAGAAAVAGGVGAAGTTLAAVGASAIPWGGLAMGAAALGGAVSAYGAYQQGQAQKNMLNYQAQAAAVQEQVVKQTAQANITGVQEQASLKATMLGRQQMAQKGAVIAGIGEQGLGGSGTAADIAKDTFTKQQLDQMTLQYNANVNSWGITNAANAQLWGLGAQESQYSMGAEYAGEAGMIGAGGSLFSSATQVGTIGYLTQR